MTAIGLLIGTVGVALIWSGIKNKSALDELRAAVVPGGKPLPSKPRTAPSTTGTGIMQAPSAPIIKSA